MTTQPDLSMAPGCYGSALTFRDGAHECSTCPFAAQCGPLSDERLSTLRASLGIDVNRPRRAPAKKTDVSHLSGDQMALPQKVVAMIGRIERAGIKVTESLRAGINPFGTTPRFLRVACHMLLHMPDGVNRRILAQAIARKLEWTENTAMSHATQACQLMVALGAATMDNDILKLKR